jgi:type I restriction enzyme S subunit
MEVDLVPFTDLLSNIVDNRGRTCPVTDTGLPLIATNCIKNDLLYPAFDNVRYVSNETYENWFRGHPLPGDLIFTCKGSPGRVCMTPDPVPFCIAQDMVAIRANPKKVYPKFLFALLRSKAVQAQIGNMHVGSLIPHFKKGDFHKLLLPVPDMRTQEFIGDTYFELSSLIELNRETNEILEEMARALFKSWFVDFDPVRAKLEGRPPAGMDAATAALFPDHFQDSELGQIPKGWEVKPIGEIVVCVGGGTPSTSEPKFWEDGVHHWTTPKDFSSLQAPFLIDTDRRITDAGLAKISSGLLPVGTVLMSSRAPVGYLAVADIPVAINQGFIAMRPNKSASNYFLLNWCQSNMIEIENRASGTTFAEISKSAFRPIPLILPPAKVMEAFTECVEPFYSQIASSLRESRDLATLRDTLLPKLLSGEISALAAEELIAAST